MNDRMEQVASVLGGMNAGEGVARGGTARGLALIGMIADGTAHDLNGLLSAMSMYTHLLERTADTGSLDYVRALKSLIVEAGRTTVEMMSLIPGRVAPVRDVADSIRRASRLALRHLPQLDISLEEGTPSVWACEPAGGVKRALLCLWFGLEAHGATQIRVSLVADNEARVACVRSAALNDAGEAVVLEPSRAENLVNHVFSEGGLSCRSDGGVLVLELPMVEPSESLRIGAVAGPSEAQPSLAGQHVVVLARSAFQLYLISETLSVAGARVSSFTGLPDARRALGKDVQVHVVVASGDAHADAEELAIALGDGQRSVAVVHTDRDVATLAARVLRACPQEQLP